MVAALVLLGLAALSMVVMPYSATDSPQTEPAATLYDPAVSVSDIKTNSGNMTEHAAIPKDIVTGNNDFAVDFYRQVSDNDNNIFFSPTSMYMAFSMLYEGARENTARQIQQVFGFDPNEALRHNATAHIMASVNQDDPHATLNLANAIWIADWFAPYDSYTDIIRNTYLASAEKVDFMDKNDGIKRINKWASENTQGKIDKVIIKKDVNKDTAMVINSAIYFKGTWLTQFPAEDTKKSDFYGNGAESTSTDFMNVHNMFDYSSMDGVQVLRMPYDGGRLSMLILLPHDADGIRQLEETLSAGQIERWMAGLRNQEVTVSVPKFETRVNYKLNELLIAMGMEDAFNPRSANLTGIAKVEPDRNLYVDKASQDAYVKVNEEGTEAAAVTTIVVMADSLPPPPPRFIADHPFIFIIQDDESGIILFMGRVSDPS